MALKQPNAYTLAFVFFRYGRITLTDASGKPSTIPLGAQFSYVIRTNTTHLSATVTYAKVDYSAIAAIGSYWAQAPVIVKTGAYVQATTLPGAPHPGNGTGQISIYALPPPIIV